jgi:hypothetical protein
VFVAAALNHLIGHSQGNPRRINVLCHNAMLAAYGAHRKRVDLASARNAVADYENVSFQPRQKRTAKKTSSRRWVRPLVLAALTAAALVALALAYVQRGYSLAGLLSSRQAAAASARATRSAVSFVSLQPSAFVPATVQIPAINAPRGGREGIEYGGYRPAQYHGDSVAVIPARLGRAERSDQSSKRRSGRREIGQILSGDVTTGPTTQNTTNDQAIP